MLNLSLQLLGNISQGLDVVVTLVGGNAQNLSVAASLIGHVEHCDRAGLNQHAGNNVNVQDQHCVQRVAVLTEGVLEVAVSGGVLHGGEQHTVQAQAAGLVVHFVLHAGAAGNFNSDVEFHRNLLSRELESLSRRLRRARCES